MKTKKYRKLTLMALVMAFLLAVALCGCGSQNAAEEPKPVLEPIPDGETVENAVETETASADAAPAETAEAPAASTETDGAAKENAAEAETPAADAGITRADGERFEDVIMIEGMEEPVHYEHFINAGIGVEMDYDYESFERYSDPELESFLSVWDGPGNPENFLEVSFSAEDADTVAAAVREELSQTYDLYEETRELNRAGECLYIEASVLKGTNNMADQLQMVYIIPTTDGCIVATVHCAAEAAEGFARRCNYMINTISALQ